MMNDACRLQRGAIAAAALGRIDEYEQISLRAHLDGCPACRAELADLTEVADALDFADPALMARDPERPSDALASKIVGRVATERARQRTRRYARVLAVAAALLLIVGLGVFVATRPDHGPDTTHVVFAPTAEGRGEAQLVSRDAGTEVRLVAQGLDDGDNYWLWLTGSSGDRVGAGTFRGTSDDLSVTLTSALPLEDARRIWVTDAEDKVVLDARL